MDAKHINEMLAKRVRDLAAKGGDVPPADRRERLLKALGLHPLPPKTELNARVTGVMPFEGYRLEKIRYEARPGELVTAHLYLPEGPGPFPVVLNPHGHWPFKKCTPHIQARGISLALHGFAALLVDSPGYSWDDNPTNERRAMGPHDDWFLSMGAPIQGIYVWDLIRGLDYLETRPEIDATKVGITGASGGGTASMYAFAVDERIRCAAPVCYVASLENSTTDGCLCNHVPGVLLLGDRTDILAMRAPDPLMIIAATVDHDFPKEGSERAYEKLRQVYRAKRAEDNLRFMLEEAQHDYNRRMREAMLAFFLEHLKGQPWRGHVPEKRPLTDGWEVPYPSGTLPAESPELLVTGPGERDTLSMRDLLRRALLEPYPEPIDTTRRLVPWARYGRLTPLEPGAILAFHDAATIQNPKEPSSIPLPVHEINQRDAIYLGLSPAELFAQLLHVATPGAPEGWETTGHLGADALTSMIASVKTLVQTSTPAEPPRMVVAEGQVSSMVALFLKRYRPGLEIEVSHHWKSWTELFDSGIRELSQPAARYLEFPSQ